MYGGEGTRILERERELAQCMAALEGAVRGRGRIVVIEGPPGIGKTALLRAVREEAHKRGARILAARGLEVEGDLTFGGVRQLLDPVLRAAPSAEVADLLAGAASPAARLFAAGVGESAADGDTAAEGDTAFAVLNALYWVLAGLADADALVLAIDDAHWLDQPSLRLLDFLAPRIEELRALVVLAMRPWQGAGPEPLGRIVADPGSRVVRPSPLSRGAITQLVRARLGEEPDPAFVDACAAATAGNPYYLSELLRSVVLRGARPTASEAAVVPSIGPRDIALGLRFRGASSHTGLALARAIAVLGDGARLEQVARLAGLDRRMAAAVADALTQESVLAPGLGAGLSFTHPIVRTAVYADLAPHERAAAHRRAARLLLDEGASIERIAAHLMNTEPAADPRVVQLLRSAATAAFAQGAPDTAAKQLRRALVEPPGRAARPRVLMELGRAEASATDPNAPAHFAEAFASAADARTRADAGVAAAASLFVQGRSGEAVAMLAAVSEQLEQHELDAALKLQAEVTAIAMNEPAAAALHLPRLDRIDEQLTADSQGARMMLCLLGFRRMLQSRDAHRAAQLAQRALASGELLGERGSEALEFAAAVLTLICADRVEPAVRAIDAALGQAGRRGSRQGFAHASFLRSMLAYRRGALRDAEADAQAALAIMVPSGLLAAAAAATSVLIAVLLERGAVDEADDALSAIGLLHGSIPAQTPYNLLLSARGRLRLACGDIVGGLADLHECGRHNAQVGARNPLFVPWRIDAALAHRGRGELDLARELAEEEIAAARGWGTPGTIGAAQRLVALLGSGEGAIATLRLAAAAQASSPARLEHARALVDRGAALRRCNRRAEAREPLTRGLDLADRCGADLLRRRALDELAAMGARPRRVRLTGLDALTASERRVAEMAARGLGNVEIAQRLFVTRKTVEKHLGSVYSKLSINSRADLPTRLL